MKNRILTLTFIVLFFIGCKQDNVAGIDIADTLYTHQSYAENKELRRLIEGTLDKDKDSLVRLTEFDCGGGSGCYDLGFIIVQIIYKLDEPAFSQTVSKLSEKEKSSLKSCIYAGLEYGYDQPRHFDVEFPVLYELLK
ncbi:hypothetical protein LJC28_00570 [Dysgonomonas sp. OttesenSCG-928-D17]|nr:hypothetical protein [Dysgonomonas sp. OttesenSCG-928-D17]